MKLYQHPNGTIIGKGIAEQDLKAFDLVRYGTDPDHIIRGDFRNAIGVCITTVNEGAVCYVGLTGIIRQNEDSTSAWSDEINELVTKAEADVTYPANGKV